MLVAEARYVGSVLGLAGAIIVLLGLALYIGNAAQLSTWAVMVLFVALLGAVGYAVLAVWLRSGQSHRSDRSAGPPARFGPIALAAIPFLIEASYVATRIPVMQATHWTRGVDSFVSSCLLMGLFAFFAFRSLRYAQTGEAAPVPAFSQKRLDQFSAALKMPTSDERRRALRRLSTRGFIRLGLVACEIVLLLSLAPRIGIWAACFVSFAIVGGVFIVAHKFYDL